MKLERDNTPCPPDQTAKIFGTIYHVARAKGETKTPGTVTIPFPLMKQYAQRVFLESPKRLEMAINIFVKLGVAKYEWAKLDEDPTAAEEIGFVHFTDLPLVEQFLNSINTTILRVARVSCFAPMTGSYTWLSSLWSVPPASPSTAMVLFA